MDLPTSLAQTANQERPGGPAIAHWRQAVRLAALQAFEEVARGLDTSARTLRAVAWVERRFRGQLESRLNAYLKDEPDPARATPEEGPGAQSAGQPPHAAGNTQDGEVSYDGKER